MSCKCISMTYDRVFVGRRAMVVMEPVVPMVTGTVVRSKLAVEVMSRPSQEGTD